MPPIQKKRKKNLPEIDLDVLINPTSTLVRMIQVFHLTTGLDLFLVLDREDDHDDK